MTSAKVYEFLTDNKKLEEIREKIRNPALSKTHQANWSQNVSRKVKVISENFARTGETCYQKLRRSSLLKQKPRFG